MKIILFGLSMILANSAFADVYNGVCAEEMKIVAKAEMQQLLKTKAVTIGIEIKTLEVVRIVDSGEMFPNIYHVELKWESIYGGFTGGIIDLEVDAKKCVFIDVKYDVRHKVER